MNLAQARKQIPSLAGLSDQDAVSVIHTAYYPDRDIAEISKALGVAPPEVVTPQAGILRSAGDVGIKLAQGAVDLGSSVVGLGSLATGGLVGKGMRAIGYDPKQTNEVLGEYLSDSQKAADAKVQQADGFVDTVAASLQNPRSIVGSIAQSAPGMLAGMGVTGAVARGIATKAALATAEGAAASAATLAAGKTAAEATKAALATSAGSKAASGAIEAAGTKLIGLGAATEGAQSAGQIADDAQAAGRDYADYALPALAAGAGTAAIGLGAGKLMGDAATEIATGARSAGVRGGLAGRVGKEVVSEGLLEEMPQSAQEQYFTNVAQGEQDRMKGVANAAGTGLVVGGAMGAGMGAMQRNHATPTQDAAPQDQATPAPAPVPVPLPNTGPLSQAANAGQAAAADKARVEAEAEAARVAQLPSLEQINARMADLVAIGRGTPARRELDQNGIMVTVPALQPRKFTADEHAEFEQLNKARLARKAIPADQQAEFDAMAQEEIASRQAQAQAAKQAQQQAAAQQNAAEQEAQYAQLVAEEEAKQRHAEWEQAQADELEQRQEAEITNAIVERERQARSEAERAALRAEVLADPAISAEHRKPAFKAALKRAGYINTELNEDDHADIDRANTPVPSAPNELVDVVPERVDAAAPAPAAANTQAVDDAIAAGMRLKTTGGTVLHKPGSAKIFRLSSAQKAHYQQVMDGLAQIESKRAALRQSVVLNLSIPDQQKGAAFQQALRAEGYADTELTQEDQRAFQDASTPVPGSPNELVDMVPERVDAVPAPAATNTKAVDDAIAAGMRLKTANGAVLHKRGSSKLFKLSTAQKAYYLEALAKIDNMQEIVEKPENFPENGQSVPENMQIGAENMQTVSPVAAQDAAAPDSVDPVLSAPAPVEATPAPAAGESSIDLAAHEAATSPLNDRPAPTAAQKEAGNYKLGHVRLQGLDLSIENPAGSTRSGVDPDGKAWETTMPHHYGYVKGTVGADKDHIDAFVGPNPASDKVFIVDQVRPDTGRFDEHKVMLGFDSLEAATAGYNASYAQDWTGGRQVSETTMGDFKQWLASGKTKKPYHKLAPQAAPVAEPGVEAADAALTEASTSTPVPAAPVLTKQQLNGMTVKDMSDAQLVQAQTVLAGGPRSPKIAKEIAARGLVPAASDVPAPGRPGTMDELVDLALSRKDGNKAFLDIGPVPEALVQRLRDEAGIDAAGWSFVIDEAAVRHIFKQHGDPQTEAARGQVAITKSDFAFLADVVAHPDSIERAQEQKDGMDTVIFKKKIDDNYVYVQELRAGRKKLAAKTLWKARLVPPAAAVAGEVHTSETSERDKPQGKNTIAGKDDAVQPKQIAGRKGGAAAAPGQAVLRGDYGVEHIDGYTESAQFPFTARGDQNEGGVKGAFLHDAQRYLKDVVRALQERGYTAASRNGKAIKPVRVNEAGPAVSGEVTLAMVNDVLGKGIYIDVSGAIGGMPMIPVTASNIGILARVTTPDDPFGGHQNLWQDTSLTAGDLAERLDNAVRRAAGQISVKLDNNESNKDQHGHSDSGTEGAPPLGNLAAEQDPAVAGGRGVERGDPDSGNPGASADRGPAAERVPGERSRGNSPEPLHPAAGGTSAGDGLGSSGTGRDGSGVSGQDARLSAGVSTSQEAAPAAAQIPARNFRITDALRLGQGGEVQKFNDNLAAIRALRAIEAGNRRATPQEQAVLARYVGWGGLANAFPSPETGQFKDAWKQRGAELSELLHPKEYALARRSTLDSHYTSQTVVNSMWTAARHLGYQGGMALESSMGTGNFIGLMPDDMAARTKFVGVEYDSLTARIASLLYPQETVLNSGFQAVPLADGAFDLAIGNPPFGDQSLRFQFKPEINGHSIHNQFFLASLDALKPGGLQVQVVSRYLLDKLDSSSRAQLAKKARLLGAIRLPDTAFKENARTSVVTDIVFLQRLSAAEEAQMAAAFDAAVQPPARNAVAEAERQALAAAVPDWVQTTQLADPLGGESMRVNSYFAAHPDMVLGVLERSGSMAYGNDITVRLDDPASLAVRLEAATLRLPQGVMAQHQDGIDAALARHKDMSDALRIALDGHENGAMTLGAGALEQVIERETPEGGFELTRRALTPETPWSDALYLNSAGQWYTIEAQVGEDGKPVKQVKNGKATNLNVYDRKVFASEADIPAAMLLGKTRHERLTELVVLRDLLKDQLAIEAEDAPAPAMEDNRRAMAAAYQSFVKAHGLISEPANSALVANMPDGALVQALEFGYRPAVTAARAARAGEQVRAASADPAPILSKRVIVPYEAPASAATLADAVAINMAEAGRVDMERIAALLGKSVDNVAADLAGADKPLLFNDPETGLWETRNSYLSGHVKRKLKAAQAARLVQNVAALEEVQPEPWGAENVTALLGSSWVPPAVYADFVQHISGSALARVSYSAITNSYSVTGAATNRANEEEWASPGYTSVELIAALLNNSAIKVVVYDKDGTAHVHREHTDLALLKAKAITAEFSDWVYKDGARRNQLVEIFNEKFNTRVMRQHDGSHLFLPGKVPDAVIAMRRHQKNTIWRGISERFMLVDHAVGAGKTFTAIARAMERRRMGLSKKPTIVVPNHMVEQFTADVYRLYPGAKVLAAGKKDFEKSRRRKLFAKIATGDFDIVIIPHSSFGFIGIAPETEERFLQEELDAAVDAVAEAEAQAEESGQSGFRKPFGVKEAERLVDKLTARMEKVRGDKSKDRLLTFEQMGIDDLTVDEAHEFKNLFYSSRLTGVKGMGNKTGSQKAFDLYSKVRVLRESPTGTVTFMTGTPISNSAVEMYNMMRYLAADELRDLGLEHFDAWRAQFVSTDAGWEPTETGRLKEVNRLGRTWSNMRSLMDLYYSFTDSVDNDDIKRAYAEDNGGAAFPIPRVTGGDRRSVVIAPTKAQIALLEHVLQGFDDLPKMVDPYERNKARLRLMDRARKVSLDVRAAEPTSTSTEEGGKLDVIADNVKRIYDKWNADRGTQLVFLDRSVPKAKGDDAILKEYDALVAAQRQAFKDDNEAAMRAAGEKLERFDPNEMEELRGAQRGGWNAYQQIKDNLITRGIPANEIRFVQEANTDAQKQALFDAVNDGTVRVLIGSTPRMGAGTNVQKRIVAIHHADVTWKPSDIEQREGRGIRQGNSLLAKYGIDAFELEILAYATERTIDAKMWALNASKLKTINAIRKYDGAFSMDFEDEESVSMAELAALASGDPLLLERVKLMSEIDKLELLKRQHARKQWGITGQIDDAERALATLPARMRAARNDLAQIRAGLDAMAANVAQRSVSVEGEAFSDGTAARRAVMEAVEAQQRGDDKAKVSIKVNGRRLASLDGAMAAVGAAIGDQIPFLMSVSGQQLGGRTEAARALAEVAAEVSAKLPLNGSDTQEVGAYLGLTLMATMERAEEGYSTTVAAMRPDGSTVASGDTNFRENPAYTTSALRTVVEQLEAGMHPHGLEKAIAQYQRRLTSAGAALPDLRARQGGPFAQQGELEAKNARLEAVIRELSNGPSTPARAMAARINPLRRADGSYLRQAPAPMLFSHDTEYFRNDNDVFLPPKLPTNEHDVGTPIPLEMGGAEFVQAYKETQQLNKQLAKQGMAPVRALRTAPNANFALARQVGKALGIRVNFVSKNSEFEGVAMGGVAYLAEGMPNAELAIAGHETLHALEQSNPALGEQLRARIRGYLNEGVVADRQMREYAASGFQAVSESKAEGEVLADINGAMWLDPVFWSDLAKADPSLFRSVAYKFMELAAKAIGSLRGARFDVSRLVSDVAAVRAIMVQTWTEHATGEPGISTKARPAMFSRASSVPALPFKWLDEATIANEIEQRIGQFAHQPPIVIRDSVTGVIPGMTSDDRVSGMLHDGRIYLFRDHLPTLRDVRQTLFHEMLHYGMRRFLTKDEYIKQMLQLAERDTSIDGYARYWASTSEAQPAHAFGGADYALARGVDEALATLAEANAGQYSRDGSLAKALRAVQGWIAELAQWMGMPVAAANWRAKSSAEARALIRQLFANMRADAPSSALPWGYSSDPAFAMAQREGVSGNDAIRFSRMGLGEVLESAANNISAVRLPANYLVGDLFNQSGKLSWWHKTLGTMDNLSKRNPMFTKVYEAVQSFIGDVSRYAVVAADLAPTLLPKLENVGDIFGAGRKKPLTAADTKAIGAPIFEGTLIWARDEHGDPIKIAELEARAEKLTIDQKAQVLLQKRVIDDGQNKAWRNNKLDFYESIINRKFNETQLKAGVVWSDAELRDMFGLGAAQIGMYREFRAALDKSLTNLSISEMVKLGGKDAKGLLDKAIETGDIGSAGELLRDHFIALAKEFPAKTDMHLDTAKQIMDLADKGEDLMNRGYAPLSRFGKFTVYVQQDGEQAYFGMFESQFEAAKMARKMRGQFPGAEVLHGTVSEENYKLFAGVSPETIELFGTMVGLDAQADAKSTEVYQTYLKLAKNNRSSMKRLIQRKGIEGFSEDAGRVLAGFIYSNARLTAGNAHLGEIDEAVMEIPKQQGQLIDAAMQLRDHIKNPESGGVKLGGLMFAQFLGGSVASAMVNLTQPVTMTLPYLSQFGGLAKAGQRLGKAVRDALKDSTGDAGLDAAMKWASEEGIVAPQEVHYLQAQAAGTGALQSGDGTKVGDTRAALNNTMSKVMVGWGKLFAMAELSNRRITFIAAYRTAVEEGMADPARFAQQAVSQTQGVYNPGNKPKWARGAVGGLLLTFKQYSIGYLELMSRMAFAGEPGSKERAAGHRGALYMIAVLFLMAGADGLPFEQDLEDAIDAILQRMGYNFSTKRAKQAFLTDVLGEGGADFALKGISSMPGMPIDVAGRFGMGNLIPGTGLMTKKDSYTQDLGELAGPAGDLAKRAFSATGKLLGGDLGGAALDISPAAVRNVAKGVDMLASGAYKDGRGYKVNDVSPVEGVMKAIGFQPNSTANIQDAKGQALNMVAQNRMRSAEIQEHWAQGLAAGDMDKVQEARAWRNDWNEKNPETPIRVSMPAIAKRVRNMRMDAAARTQKTAPAALKQTVRNELSEVRQ